MWSLDSWEEDWNYTKDSKEISEGHGVNLYCLPIGSLQETREERRFLDMGLDTVIKRKFA